MATSPIRISTCGPGARMRIMRSRQPALPAPPHPLMRVAAATSASPRRTGCTRLYFPQTRFPENRCGRALRDEGTGPHIPTYCAPRRTAVMPTGWSPSHPEFQGGKAHRRDLKKRAANRKQRPHWHRWRCFCRASSHPNTPRLYGPPHPHPARPQPCGPARQLQRSDGGRRAMRTPTPRRATHQRR